jgi:PAS domain S-box-containing protein
MDTEFFKRLMQVLHLEDNENDHLLVAETLRDGGLKCEFVVAKSKDEFIAALGRGNFDLIISDYTLPSYDGLTALATAREKCPQTPFVFFSGTIGEEVAVESLKHGAVDYVLKQRPHRLIPAIRRALRNAEEQARLRQAEAKIREQVDLLDKAQDAIIVCNLERSILYWNKGAERLYGWSAAEVVGQNIRHLLFHDNPPPHLPEVVKSLEEHGEWNGEMPEFTKSGRSVIVQARSTMIRDEQGRPKSLLIINTDITERKLLEEQFLRAQRLESLGALVSGIAHDLNNALVPIIIGVEILRSQSLSEDAESMLRTMETSARRSAEMIKQMLTFARGGETKKSRIHVNHLIKEMGRIVADTFLKSVVCQIRVDKNVPPVYGILTQLHQVLMNLCINARDAMPNGGTLTIAAENVSFKAGETLPHPDVKPGNYVCITIADTGTGISADQLEKIFQPFFTTKSPGKGTGLGLSTCQSIVKNHDGFITVSSQVNIGTQFKVYLPAPTSEKKPSESVPMREPAPPVGKGELVLVVDDEEGLLAIMRTALENYGYKVLTAIGGLEGVARFKANSTVKLVIVDFAMPLMDGVATVAALRKISPDVRIIMASGSEGEFEEARQRAKVNTFIQKPFTTESLLETVHGVLAEK